jgi:hypothetical protein
MDDRDEGHPRPCKVDDDTRATLRLAATEAENAMLHLIGVGNEDELIPADEIATLRRVTSALEDCCTRLYAMSVRGADEPQ